MSPTFIRLRDLASRPGKPGRIPASEVTIWRWVRDGHFPSSVKLGPHMVGWSVAEVERWERLRAAGQPWCCASEQEVTQ